MRGVAIAHLLAVLQSGLPLANQLPKITLPGRVAVREQLSERVLFGDPRRIPQTAREGVHSVDVGHEQVCGGVGGVKKEGRVEGDKSTERERE